jgi:hypothetical protein
MLIPYNSDSEMEFFNKVAAVRLRGHLDKYLVADDDAESVRQSRNGETRKARWLVELVDGNSHVVRLKSCHGKYLTASNASFLLGMTGHKVIQSIPENPKDLTIEWQPVRDGFQIKLRAFTGTYLRANGGTLPWRNTVTHDSPVAGSTHNWVLWDVQAVDVPEDESMNDYLTMVTSFSSVYDELSGLDDLASPVSVKSINSPRFNFSSKFSMKKKNYIRPISTPAMDLFLNAKAVRLRSHHDKYLTAHEDEESVSQERDSVSKSARWSVEFVENSSDKAIRLKSCYGKYLTASNQPFLLGMTGRKVLQTLPSRLDSSVEWEPVREGKFVKLRTRYGQFLRGNGGLPPWRNSVTHDIPHRTSTQDWILWEVNVVDIVMRPPVVNNSTPELEHHSDSFASTESSSDLSTKSDLLSRQESIDSLVYSPPKRGIGRTVYYQVADEFGNVEEGDGIQFITFKGNDVQELTRRLADECGFGDIIVCLKSQLDGKLYPLKLQLPPNNVTMNVVIVQSFSTVGSDLAPKLTQ